MQLVAFFYGKERRGNALPLASVSKGDLLADASAVAAAAGGAAAKIISEVWPAGAKRDPDGQPARAAAASSTTQRGAPPPTRAPPAAPPPKGLAERARAESAREITLSDVAALARL